MNLCTQILKFTFQLKIITGIDTVRLVNKLLEELSQETQLQKAVAYSHIFTFVCMCTLARAHTHTRTHTHLVSKVFNFLLQAPHSLPFTSSSTASTVLPQSPQVFLQLAVLNLKFTTSQLKGGKRQYSLKCKECSNELHKYIGSVVNEHMGVHTHAHTLSIYAAMFV